MKILLQHTGSGLFFKALDTWVRDETEARVFITALSALEFCEQHGICAAQIILRPEDAGEDAPLDPVTSSTGLGLSEEDGNGTRTLVRLSANLDKKKGTE